MIDSQEFVKQAFTICLGIPAIKLEFPHVLFKEFA